MLSGDNCRFGAGALAVLELLATEAPVARIESLIGEAVEGGVPDAELESVKRAVQLGLTVYLQTQRRQQRETGLSAVLDTAKELAVTDLDALLNIVARRARLLLGADMSYISLVNSAGDDGWVRAAEGNVAILNMGLRLPGGAGLGSAALSRSAPFWTSDYLADQRIRHSDELDEVARAEGLRAVLAVPLGNAGQPVGVLFVAHRNVRHFRQEEIALLRALGDLAGTAVEWAGLLAGREARVAALEHEKAEVENGRLQARSVGAIHRELVELVLAGAGLEVLATTAAKHLNGELRIYGANRSMLSTTGAGLADAAAAMEQVPAAGAPAAWATGVWTAPVCAGTEQLGTVVLRPYGPFSERDEELLELVTHAVAVQLVLDRERGSGGNPGQARDDLLDDLLTASDQPARRLAERARALGLDPDRPHLVVVARPEGGCTHKTFTWASSYTRRTNGLKNVHADRITLLLPGTDASAAAQAVSAELTPLLGVPVTVSAAGPMAELAAVRSSYDEALRCLDAMTALGAVGCSASPGDLGFLGVLLSDNHDAEGYIDAVIGPVLDYDDERLTELGRTLGAYFETGGSPTHAARRLHVHPNTVARRLERIRELLGPDWQEPERALEVQLALRLSRIRRVLMGRRSATAGRPTDGQDA